MRRRQLSELAGVTSAFPEPLVVGGQEGHETAAVKGVEVTVFNNGGHRSRHEAFKSRFSRTDESAS